MDIARFGYPTVRRIARAVRTVEAGNRRGQPLRFQRQPDPVKRQVRIATFTGSWAIGATKTVTFKFQAETPNTAMVTNLVCGLSPTGSCDVSIARDGSAWFLVQPNLTQLPGYASSGTQVMAVISGNLQFVGTTACGTAA